jgi:hypothetical protein
VETCSDLVRQLAYTIMGQAVPTQKAIPDQGLVWKKVDGKWKNIEPLRIDHLPLKWNTVKSELNEEEIVEKSEDEPDEEGSLNWKKRSSGRWVVDMGNATA